MICFNMTYATNRHTAASRIPHAQNGIDSAVGNSRLRRLERLGIDSFFRHRFLC
jgi:hypothetical protein